MGLDELIQKAIGKYNNGITYGGLCDLFPDDNGKISRRLGYLFARNLNGKPKASAFFSIEKHPVKSRSPDDDPIEFEYFARFQYLLHAIRQIHNTAGNKDRLDRLKKLYAENQVKNAHFNSEDLALLLPLIEFTAKENVYKLFYENLEKTESEHEPVWPFDRPYDRKKFRKLLEDERQFIFAHAATQVDSIRKVVEEVANTEVNIPPTKKLIENLIEERDLLIRALLGTSTATVKVFDKLRVNLNCPEIAEDNNVNCCIAGPDGKSKEASMIYALDKSVHYWSFMSSKGIGSPSFGLAIFFEAMGRHASSEKPERYLVCEGFPMNREYYNLIDKVDNPRNWLPNPPLLSLDDMQKSYSLPKLVYSLGLKTANFLGIPKLFVNACHSGIQKSVEDVVRVAAKESELTRETWEWDAKHGEFSLLKDPYTGKDFATIEVPVGDEIRKFKYTHFFKKKPIPSSLVRLIRLDPNWKGESCFDTFYEWNKFLMKNYNDKWPEELKKQHPYAESVAKRGKDPQWNLGIGYCKGFEVDVKRACDDLGIK